MKQLLKSGMHILGRHIREMKLIVAIAKATGRSRQQRKRDYTNKEF